MLNASKPTWPAIAAAMSLFCSFAAAQTSSLARRADEPPPSTTPSTTASTPDAAHTSGGAPIATVDEPRPRVSETVRRNSLIAVEPRPPRTFAVGDHVTVIVREQLTFKADADSQSKNDFKVKSELDAFFKPIDGGLGATTFARGKPNIDYKLQESRRNEADVSSENRLVTRLTAEIIDIKPNGNLVLSAKARIQHGEEISEITLTGTCSKKKLSADDSVLSTDVADKVIHVQTKGSVRDGASRGWLTRLIDTIKPL